MSKVLISLFVLMIASNVFAATYYIDGSYSGAESGTFAEPYNHVNDLPSIAAGDDIYFKCDTTVTLSGQWSITWSGTGGANYSIIGAYYDNGGSPAYGVQGSKPIIDVQWDGVTGTWPEPYTAAISSNNKTYLQFENIKIINTAAKGLDADYCDYILIDGVDVDTAHNAGIRVGHADNDIIIRNCDVTNTGRMRILSPPTDYPASIAANVSSNCTIENNTVYENYGEGIGAYNGSDHITIQNNLLYDNKVNIYTDYTQYVTIRYNLVIGNPNTSINAYDARGIGAVDEGRHSSDYLSYIYIYNNIVINTRVGIFMSKNAQNGTSGTLTDGKVHRNTLIGNDIGIRLEHAFGEPTYTGCAITQNVIWTFTGEDPGDIRSNSSGISWGNHWYGDGTVDPDGTDSSDVISTNSPGIGNQSESSWESVTYPEAMPTITDIAPILGSNLIDVSSSITGYNNMISYTSLLPPSDTTIVTTYSVSGWDAGAIEYSGLPNSPPVTLITSPAGPQSGSDPSSFAFSGTCTDADGDDVSGLWDFDGGATNHSCSEAATPLTCNAGSTEISGVNEYTMTLTCTDEHGASSYQTVEITIGAPSAPTPYFEWYLENDLTDEQSHQSLADGDSISYATGDEPDPPGYGTYHAIFNGSSDNLSVTNANLGNHAGNGTSDEFTACIMLSPDTVSGYDYVLSLGDPTSGWKWVILLDDGSVNILTGYNNGDSYNDLYVGPSFSGGTDIGICLGFDGTSNSYNIDVLNADTSTYYFETEEDQALSGSYNTGDTPNLIIGGRSDLSASSLFDGNIYWVALWDEMLTRAEMEEYLENTSAGSNISRCFISTGDKTYTTDDTLGVCCDLVAETDLTGGEDATFTINDDDALALDLTTSNGSNLTQICFEGTILSGDFVSGGAEINAVSVNAITLNTSVLEGMNDDVPISGPGSIAYESNGYIDTSAPTLDTLYWAPYVAGQACADWSITDDNFRYFRGHRARMVIISSDSTLFNDGQSANFETAASLTVGDDLVFNPVGGWGTTRICLESQVIEPDMELHAISDALDHTDELDRDAVTTGVPSTIENYAGDGVAVNGNGNYDIPAPSNTATVDGTTTTFGAGGGCGAGGTFP